MHRSLLRLQLAGLLTIALAGCRSVERVGGCPGCFASGEDSPTSPVADSAPVPVPTAETPARDPAFDCALRTFGQPVPAPPRLPPGTAATSPYLPTKTVPQRITTGVIRLPELQPRAASTAPGLPAPTAALQGEVLDEKPQTLRGRLEPGLEPGTWNLRYETEAGTNRTGGVVKLVAPQPLCGCRKDWEARVEGHLTWFGWEKAFQVERLVVSPPPVSPAQQPVSPAQPPVSKGGPPGSGERRRSLVGRLEPDTDRGKWDLLYYPNPTSNRPVGVVQLVSEHPLDGLQKGREVQVVGYVTWAGMEPVFQVESLATMPRQGQPLTGPAR
jgi:hypothetical protein